MAIADAMWYIESSAFMRLVVDEPRSPQMRAWLAEHRGCWSSQLLRTEAMRTARRRGVSPEVVAEALETVTLVLPVATTFQIAEVLMPWTVATLDALHVATAIEMGPELDGIVTYDERVRAGARAASLTVLSP